MNAKKSGGVASFASPCPSSYAITLSIVEIAMSNFPSDKPPTCITDPVAGVSFTSRSSAAKNPFSAPIQNGQLNPPGNVHASIVRAAGHAAVLSTTAMTATANLIAP